MLPLVNDGYGDYGHWPAATGQQHAFASRLLAACHQLVASDQVADDYAALAITEATQ